MASFTKGLSIHHETKSSSQASSNPCITNNISINASNELSESSPYKVLDSSEVKYEQPVASSEQSNVERENEFLRKVIAIYMGQKFYFSGKYLVLTSDELLDLIQTLLPNKSIVITSEDIDVNCCGIKDAPIKKVESIWVGEGDQQTNFKYGYSNLVALLDSYKISIKFTRSI